MQLEGGWQRWASRGSCASLPHSHPLTLTHLLFPIIMHAAQPCDGHSHRTMPHSTSSQLAALLLLAVAAVAAAVAVDTELPLEAPLQKRHHKDHPGAGGDPGFDLFVFVRSYSPTFCKETACSIRPM